MTTYENGFYSLIINHRARKLHCTFFANKVIVRYTNDPLVGTCNQSMVHPLAYFESILEEVPTPFGPTDAVPF